MRRSVSVGPGEARVAMQGAATAAAGSGGAGGDVTTRVTSLDTASSKAVGSGAANPTERPSGPSPPKRARLLVRAVVADA